MKRVFLLIFTVCLCLRCYSQKQLVTDSTYKSWTEASNGMLSCDGKFAAYFLNNKPVGGKTLVLTTTNRQWTKEYPSFDNPNFSGDSKYLIAMHKDSLVKLDLVTRKITKKAHCIGYDLLNSKNNQWLISQLDTLGILNIQNLVTNRAYTFNNILSYVVNEKTESVILIVKGVNNQSQGLKILNLSSGITKEFYNGEICSDIIFDFSGRKIAFTVTSASQKEIFYFDSTLTYAKKIADNQSVGINQSFQIATDDIWRFSSDGNTLFFTQTPRVQNLPTGSKLKIWNYQDSYLLPNYQSSIIGKSSIMRGCNLTCLNISENKIKQLLSGQQKIKNPFFTYTNTDVLIVESTLGRADELPWNPFSKLSYYLCYTKTGELKPIKINSTYAIDEIDLSPDNKYILYFDPEAQNYISINLQTLQEKIIDKQLSNEFFRYSIQDRGSINGNVAGNGIVAWVNNTHQAIVQGTYDLWKLDLDNDIAPSNLTGSEGRKTMTIYTLVLSPNQAVYPKGVYLVKGFNLKNKSCSINRVDLKTNSMRQLFLTTQAYDVLYSGDGGYLQKAKYSDSYLLRLGQGNNLINYAYTKGFKKITPISNNHPEKKFNWIKTELITYDDEFGNKCEGLLYKPENFDPHRKYPVIFHYYMDASNELNDYISPSPSNSGFNIPILTSHDYLVCVPNIYRIKHNPGKAALISVLAAANYLSGMHWVDSSKMGIIGHSFGGFETNFIVSHSNRFSAAISCAGISSIIDNYNDIWGGLGFSVQSYVKGAYSMEVGLEKMTDKYIENSPILDSKDINTPLLLMHNDGDENVFVEHSKRFFIQLRSMQKPTWLLQYDQEAHTLGDVNNQLDFQDKVLEFFDHFLKEKSAPQWMTNSINPLKN